MHLALDMMGSVVLAAVSSGLLVDPVGLLPRHGSPARPDLWEPWESDFPGLPGIPIFGSVPTKAVDT